MKRLALILSSLALIQLGGCIGAPVSGLRESPSRIVALPVAPASGSGGGQASTLILGVQ